SPAPPATAASANPPSRVAAPRPAAAPMHRQAAAPSRIRKMAIAPTGMAIPYPASNPEITAAFISGTSRQTDIGVRLYLGDRRNYWLRGNIPVPGTAPGARPVRAWPTGRPAGRQVRADGRGGRLGGGSRHPSG